jgi:hypothetical protein
MNGHVDDRAALYALGSLDEREAEAVRAHVAGCLSCAQAIGAAEAEVDAAAEHEPQFAAPAALRSRIDRMLSERPTASRRASGVVTRPAYAPWLALAAAFIIGVLPSAYFLEENRRMHDAMGVQSAAMDRLATSTHRVAAFRPMPAMSEGSSASVAYGSSGQWYVVVVKDVSRSMGVAWMHDGQQTMLGQAVPHGNVAMLFLPKSHRMDRLALVDDGQVVAQASLHY